MVVIVFGLPGSGKSYFAAKLAEKLGARYINSDVLRLQMFATRTYTDAEKLLVYDAMAAAMTEALKSNSSIVLDATFYKEAIRNAFEQKAAAFNEQIHYIEVTAPEDLIAERVNRPRRHSEANYDVYLKLKGEFEPMQQEHLVLVSSNSDITPFLTQAIGYINNNK